jgi:hypothetical protein
MCLLLEGVVIKVSCEMVDCSRGARNKEVGTEGKGEKRYKDDREAEEVWCDAKLKNVAETADGVIAHFGDRD